MSQPALLLLVRFKSPLSLDEVTKVVDARIAEFRAFPGLQQKYYLQDPATGEYAGLYLWESAEALAAYRESQLRASIARAYQVAGEPRLEVYEVLRALRDDPAA